MLGPKRFKDLLAVLPAMGTNRLSERLASLTADGVVRKSVLPPPASISVHELTEHGEQLRGPLMALSLWGQRLPLDERIETANVRAELIALTLAGSASPAMSVGIHEVYEFHVGSERFHFRVDDGRVLPRSGPALAGADLSVACDIATFMGLALRSVTPEEAVLDHRAALLTGTLAQFVRAFSVLGFSV